MSLDNLRTQRHTQAMVALDNFDAIAERVQQLLADGRRISIARRYLHTDSPVELKVGLTLDPDGHGGGVHVRRDESSGWIGVSLKPGLTEGFGFGAYSGEADTESAVWALFHQGAEYRRNMTQVIFTGGLPGWGPMLDDQLVIRRYNTYGVCAEKTIGFDTPLHWAEQEAKQQAEGDALAKAGEAA